MCLWCHWFLSADVSALHLHLETAPDDDVTGHCSDPPGIISSSLTRDDNKLVSFPLKMKGS